MLVDLLLEWLGIMEKKIVKTSIKIMNLFIHFNLMCYMR